MLTTTVRPGEAVPDFLHNHRLLPPGSTLATRSGYPIEVEDTGILNVRRSGSGILELLDWSQWLYGFRLTGLPEGDALTLPPLDLDTLRWRIRDAALAAAERSGVSITPVLSMLKRIGADQPRLGLGGIVSNKVDIATLPDKAVLYLGNPSRPGKFSVYRKRGGELNLVLGTYSHRPEGTPLVLYSAQGIDELPTPTAADKVELAQLAVKAWRIGKQVKAAQNWCGVFEETLAMLGIDESVASVANQNLRTAGETVDRVQAQYLPVGTLLWWAFRASGWSIYQRVEGARNIAQTRWVWGHQSNRENSHEQMTIIHIPGDPMSWRVPGYVLQYLPDGTRFRIAGSDQPFRTLPDDNIPSWQHHEVIELGRFHLVTAQGGFR